MDINISEANQFIGLHAHPQDVNSNDLGLINNWISKYPYCQTLHILAAQATKSGEQAESHLAKAATFVANREALFQFTHNITDFTSDSVVLDDSINANNETVEVEVAEPQSDMGQAFGENLNYYKVDEAKAEGDIDDTPVAEEEIIIEETLATESVEGNPLEEEKTVNEDPVQETETIEEPVASENVEETQVEEEAITEQPVQETETIEEPVASESVEETPEEEEQTVNEEPAQETETIEEPVTSENVEETQVEEEDITEEQAQETESVEEPIVSESVEETSTEEEENIIEEQAQETETIEEAVTSENVEETPVEEEDIIEEQAQEIETIEEPVASESVEEAPVEEEENIIEEQVQETETPKEEELILESPVASDFFAFAKGEKNLKETAKTNLENQKKEEKPSVKTKEDVSQYNDESLPYTFLWWLNKTRKEHATNTQPYIKTEHQTKENVQTPADQSLNHQIAENIFHLRGAEEIASIKPKNQTVPFDFRKKEYSIIEKFIKEEPQIKPPAANKIDSENKAKKSSEDANQVVSETLAKIYVEQMLYHKALDVYKKLSLKYPEKSAYFASQIKYLELKVN